MHSQNFAWANHSGDSQEDGGNAVALDASGNLYSIGKFAGTVDFDPGPETSALSSSYPFIISLRFKVLIKLAVKPI